MLRFCLAVLVMVGLILAGARHAFLVPTLITCERNERSKFLRDGFVWRLRCITLSGGFARWILCRSRCNGVYRAPDGMVFKPSDRSDARTFVDEVSASSRFLRHSGCLFFYVQMANKEGLGGCGCPAAYGECYEDRRCEEIVTELSSSLEVIDLRPVVSATAGDVRENFLKTDHHWNFEGAFKAFGNVTSNVLVKAGVDRALASEQLDRANWIRKPLLRSGARFLGSWGRRTGPWFSGFDRVEYLVPKFKTELQADICDRTGRKYGKSGDFINVFINRGAIAPPSTWYEDYGYDVYLGDHSRVEIVNESAPVRKTVLIVKDSYFQPLVAWMSTVFVHVVAVDPRFGRGAFIDDVRAVNPDLTLVAVSYCRPGYFASLTH